MVPRISKDLAAGQFKERAHRLGKQRPGQNVAYLCMEYGLKSSMHIYSGGLGILAGDTVKSAADLGLPLFPVGLLYRDGYFRQVFDRGRQLAEKQAWHIERSGLVDLQSVVTLPIAGQNVNAKAWGLEIPGQGGAFVPLTLLDTLGVQNPHGSEEITSQLYSGGSWQRLVQEMVLGIGGVRALQIYDLPFAYYHLNEGHAAFATVEVLRRLGKTVENLDPGDYDRVRQLFSFTTHTPVPAGFDKFSTDEVARAFSDEFMRKAVLSLGRDPHNRDYINMALLAMRLSGVRNGVSQLHAQVSERMFPEFCPIIGITNGVHHLTWAADHSQKVLDQFAPEWRKDPCKLSELNARQDDPLFRDAVWSAHQANKGRLLGMVNRSTGVKMERDVFTLGFARRFATYKRGDLLFENEAELLRLAEEHGGLQIIMSGKAHPADKPGQGLIANVMEAGRGLMERSGGRIKFAFVEDYDMDKAALLVAGVDSWLNTPLRPHEASGTSGMKAAFNFVPNISVSDGWWAEARGGGWTVGEPNLPDSVSLYQRLDEAMAAYQDRGAAPTFINKMIEEVAKNAAYFNTHRMVEEYSARVWRPRTLEPLMLPEREERRALPLSVAFDLLGEVALGIARAPEEKTIEEQAAAALLKALNGCLRVTRYDAHNESVRIARSWIGSRFGTGVFSYEERPSVSGASAFDHWVQIEKFSGEVMADMLRQKTTQIVADPSQDSRCFRDGRPSGGVPFILVPEIVNGEVCGAYKLDFPPGGLNLEEHGRALIDALLNIVGRVKAERLKAELAADFSDLKEESAVIGWALTLATAGGFVDMPRYAIEGNRAAVFMADKSGDLVGFQAVGEVGKEAHDGKLVELSKDQHREGMRGFLRQQDQSRASLYWQVHTKKIGANIVSSVIQVKDGFTFFDHTACVPGFDTTGLRGLMENTGRIFTVDGRKIETFLLLPLNGDDGRPIALAYVDNAFTGKPLNPDKLTAIFNAAAKRIAELRAAAAG
jgi:starch phosphorylase